MSTDEKAYAVTWQLTNELGERPTKTETFDSVHEATAYMRRVLFMIPQVSTINLRRRGAK